MHCLSCTCTTQMADTCLANPVYQVIPCECMCCRSDASEEGRASDVLTCPCAEDICLSLPGNKMAAGVACLLWHSFSKGEISSSSHLGGKEDMPSHCTGHPSFAQSACKEGTWATSSCLLPALGQCMTVWGAGTYLAASQMCPAPLEFE